MSKNNFFTYAPSQLPCFQTLIARLRNGIRHPEAIAKHLGVTPQTVSRWMKSNSAPRAVLYALFWETDLGFSVLNCELHNEAQVHRAHASGLKRYVATLHARIEFLESRRMVDSANQPFFCQLPGISENTTLRGSNFWIEKSASSINVHSPVQVA